MKIGRLCGKNLLHALDGVLNDAFYRASPTGMNRSNGIVFGIVEEHRNAVCRRHSDAETALPGHDGIVAFCFLSAFFCGQMPPCVVDDYAFCLMHLVRHNDMTRCNAQFRGSNQAVTRNIIRVVATEFVDIECAKDTLADASLTGRAESTDTFCNAIFV